MAPMLRLSELYDLKKTKDNIKKVSFDKITELSHRRIRNIAAFGGQNTFFEIPGMLIGYPLYDMYDCLNYVVDALRKNGLLVQILPPPNICVIYISWSPEDVKKKDLPALQSASNFEIPRRLKSAASAAPMSAERRKKLQYTF
jgi:hypothetical protein